ncbi:calcium/sodium antiporter [Lunatibacter salilacus]|uniref:calcium/sodium antiporter n=1 Tax=Lunatibacter salilacus TaxID=2483804 RepID=UPI00131E73C0|nr:calcium/sodium antiporter [Lunatibacter salilacus]
MIVSVGLLLLGFVILVYGADKLVEAASSLASGFGVSQLVIGLTIVAFGTSAPEMVVNVFASMDGSSQMVLGNVLGSNIFNVFAILGIAAVILPLQVKTNTTWIEIPLSFLAAVLVLVLVSDVWLNDFSVNLISRGDGIVLLLFFSVFLVYNIVVSKNPDQHPDSLEIPVYATRKAIFWILVGLGGLILGGKLIVDNAISIALDLGLSERIIGLTIVSVGTSLPELATSVAAVRKNKVDIAIGNVVGSNIFNIFFILGVSAVIGPVVVADANYVDILINILAGLLLFIFIFTGKGRILNRLEGGIFLVIYVIYIASLVLME